MLLNLHIDKKISIACIYSKAPKSFHYIQDINIDCNYKIDIHTQINPTYIKDSFTNRFSRMKTPINLVTLQIDTHKKSTKFRSK